MSEQGAGHEPNKAEQKVGDTLHAAAGKEVNKVVDAARRDIDEEGEEERRDIVIHAGYELFVAGFLVVQLVNSALFFLPLESEQRHIVREFWIGISIFLFLDALVRLRRAPSKHRHMFTYYGWLTWVGSMPIPFVTGVRLFGTSIALRKLRRGEFKEIGRVVVARHAQSTRARSCFWRCSSLSIGSLMVLVAEQNAPNANITTSAGRDLVEPGHYLDGRVRRYLSHDLPWADHWRNSDCLRRWAVHIHHQLHGALVYATAQRRGSRNWIDASARGAQIARFVLY